MRLFLESSGKLISKLANAFAARFGLIAFGMSCGFGIFLHRLK